MSNESFRSHKQTPTQTPNPYSLVSGKKSSPTSPFKSSLKSNLVRDKTRHSIRKYALNKTSVGTPFDKSAMLSYISTPNQNSMTMNKASKLKKFKSNRNILVHKTKQAFQSTEDENLSDQCIKIDFMLSKRKIGSHKFYAF